MRNLKRALSLALASVMLLGMMVVGTSAAGYTDVDANDNLEAIEVLQLLGIMSGDDKGNFNPDATLSRNEMAVIMVQVLGLTPGGSHPFTDVPDWASSFVAACYNNGITGGTSATTYSGSASITTVEASLMLMKALGYFTFTGEFKDNWQLATITQAQKIGLFDGVNAAVTAPLTRNQMAQLVLNALESDVIVAEENGGMSVEGNGISVSVNPDYTYYKIARTNDYTNGGDRDKAGYQQLVEKRYDNKVKKDVSGNKVDDFGRPAAEWTYAGKSVTSPEAADATYTTEVNAKTIYNDLGLSANLTAAEVTTYTDGKDNDANVKAITKNDTDTKWGGNGVLVEVYRNETAAGVVTGATVVVTNTYLDEVASVDENDDGNLEVTLEHSGLTFETAAFKAEDMVLYTKATADNDTEIVTMKAANVVSEVEVTRVTASSSFVAGGTTYKYNPSIETNYAKLTSGSVGDIINVYVDDYGYVVGTELYEGASSYAYVIDVAKEGNWSTDATYLAKLLLADGTVAEVEYDPEDANNDDSISLTEYKDAYLNKIVEYTVNSKNVYTLEAKSTTAASIATVDVNKGEAKMTLGGTYYADAKTIFLLQKDEGSDATYTAYTGIANVPNLDGTTVTGAVYATGSNLAKVVYLKDVSTASESNEIVYVMLSTAEYGKDSELGEYYTYDAVVNGKITTISFKYSDAPTTTGTVNTNVALYKTVSYNGDGLALASKCTAYDNVTTKDEYVVAGAVTTKATDGAIGVTNVYYTLGDSVKVYEVDNTDDEITTATISKVAARDQVEMIVQDGKVVAIFWLNH